MDNSFNPRPMTADCGIHAKAVAVDVGMGVVKGAVRVAGAAAASVMGLAAP